MKEVNLRSITLEIVNGEKTACIDLTEPTELEGLAAITGALKAVGASISLMRLLETYHAYTEAVGSHVSAFHREMEPTEDWREPVGEAGTPAVTAAEEETTTTVAESLLQGLTAAARYKMQSADIVKEGTTTGAVTPTAVVRAGATGGVVERPKQVPLIGDHTTFTLADSLVPADVPDRIVDGRELYKTRYTCPECNTRSNRFVALDQPYTTCHECKEKLEIELINEDGSRDEFGHKFIANEIWRRTHE